MGTKHTPGDWKAIRLKTPVGYANWAIKWSDDGELVADIIYEEADAVLMAASKDLLAAAEAIDNWSKNANPMQLIQELDHVIEQVRAAIKKAGGTV